MPFGSLWLPVLVSAVAVWLVSAILHMALKYHRADYKQLSDEESVAQAVRKAAPAPGLYVIPYCMEMAQMKDPAVRKRYDEGPVATLTVLRNGPPAMGKYLGQWFLFCVLVSFVTSYVARHTLSPGADGLTVLRLTGTVAFVGYGLGYFQDSIWKGIPWSNSLRGLIDAAIYGLVTGLVFRFLWPGA
ncbi:MAG TPA: hypothetical protein VE685_06305 [Thermoanaerobaculia bacterium]|nr:hypothetical protein [Thermoanaerobaculia bacterium]